MQTHLDYVAVTGYSCLFVFTFMQFQWTLKKPLDTIANVLILIGLASLIAYHIRVITTKKTETTDNTQKNIRLVAHSTITIFLLITLMSFSTSIFQFYDWFALFGHAILFLVVLLNKTQIPGVGLLAGYFVLASYHTAQKSGWEMLNLVGRMIMSVFFVVSFFKGIMTS
jgi:hypothetical protein